MVTRPYSAGPATFDSTTVFAILEYKLPNISPQNSTVSNLQIPSRLSRRSTGHLLSRNSPAQFPANVPQKVDKNLFFTVGLGTNLCPKNQTCQGHNGTKLAASINNISFTTPTTAMLQAFFFSKSNAVYTTDFPSASLIPFNYTGNPPNNTDVANGTKLVVRSFNTTVELVQQDTSIFGAESHPLHHNGYNFYGQGFGNFDPQNDPPKFNLVDLVERNTVGVPFGGWTAIRFRADNPGFALC